MKKNISKESFLLSLTLFASLTSQCHKILSVLVLTHFKGFPFPSSKFFLMTARRFFSKTARGDRNETPLFSLSLSCASTTSGSYSRTRKEVALWQPRAFLARKRCQSSTRTCEVVKTKGETICCVSGFVKLAKSAKDSKKDSMILSFHRKDAQGEHALLES